MVLEDNEKRFEQDIESFLLSKKGGYIKGDMSTFDKKKALDMAKLIEFISSTQPKEWARYQRIYLDKAEDMLYKRIQESINAFGLIYTLRHGIDDRGVRLQLVYFLPGSKINQDLIDLYEKNIMTCTRQFAYSLDNHNTIDMVLSVNGIPVVALELKNQLKNQTYENAELQWKYDRDPRELIFNFDKRILVYFAVDTYYVSMTTKLDGENTFFLPFNQGSNGAGNVGGAGNPMNENGYCTSYLWENVLQRDMLLAILQRYISRQEDEKIEIRNGKKTKKKSVKIIFPRYHQLDVVEKTVFDVYKNGCGKNYLIQHSAGSGKSNSIAWLVYRLSSLHDKNNKPIYDTVIVVTDRRILNKQLQNTITGFDHKAGLIETIDDEKPATVLKQAINDGRKIIITTLQKFPVIYQEVNDQSGKKFAVVVDEAHSSQTGNSAQKLKRALADTEEALREYEELYQEEVDAQDVMLQEVLAHGKHKNMSFFAFTATPKAKTLEMFGEKQPDNSFRPFHIYSMRQAIDEGFILDVLRNYTTVSNFFKIAKDTPENEKYKVTPAMRAIMKFYLSQDRVIEDYVEVIVEQFRQVTLNKINGKAKAMVVCPTRKSAVGFYFKIKEYIEKKHYTDVRPLVAFSGTVDIDGKEYKENQLNYTAEGKRISEDQLKTHFSGDEFNTLVVADKYQTGFDEPLLHTMFILKKLNSVKAVQTLSRVNRTCVGKVDTFILDFVNTADEIRNAFQPYYEDTVLSSEFNVNLVYDNLTKIKKYSLFNQEDVEKFVKIYTKKVEQTNTDLGKLTSIFKPVIDRFNDLTEEQRFDYRDAVKSFNRFYSYIVQITRTFDKELHQTYLFTEYLAKLLPRRPFDKVNLDDKLKLEFTTLKETFSGCIELKKSPENMNNKLNPAKNLSARPVDEKKELLDAIIEKINIMYEGKFDEKDRVIVETIYNRMVGGNTAKLKKYAKNTDRDMFTKSIFPDQFDKIAQDCYTDQVEGFSKLFNNQDLYNKVMTEMGKALYKILRQ